MLKKNGCVLILLGFLCGAFNRSSAQSSQYFETDVTLTSARPIGNAINDRLLFRFFAPQQSLGQKIPGVIIIHSLDDKDNHIQYQFARFLVQQDIASAVITLPYHMKRLPPKDSPLRHFMALNPDEVVDAMEQSVSDVSTVVDWLQQHPIIDSNRIGVVGISLGGIIAHLVMGKDERVKTGVSILGGGNLEDIYRHNVFNRLLHPHLLSHFNVTQRERLKQVDPLTYAEQNQPRRVLMIQAARDLVIPPQDAMLLWKALHRPPIQWMDTNHYAPLLATASITKASAAFLLQTWDMAAREQPVPIVYAPTIKAGILFNLDTPITLGVQWQFVSLFKRSDHMSLLHTDLGWSGRGPFIGFATTLNQFIDVGVGHRFFGNTYVPYASVHIVF